MVHAGLSISPVAIPLGQGQVFNASAFDPNKKAAEVAIPLGQGQVFNIMS